MLLGIISSYGSNSWRALKRRSSSVTVALAVYQYLTSQKYDVFFDFSSLSSGDFEQIIVSNIRARAHFILVLTPTALDRCSQPGDWLGARSKLQ